MRTAAAWCSQIWQIEVPRLELVGFDFLIGVIREDLLFQRLERDAEVLQLGLVALEFAADRLARPSVAADPVLLIVGDLAENLLSRGRIVPA